MLIIYGGTHISVNRSAEKMSLTILYPDAQFAGDPDVEREVFGMDTVLHIFRARHVGEIPAELWCRCEVILCFDIELDAKIIANAARCRQIVRAGVGFDNIDIAAAAACSIPVCNTPDYGTTDVADHAIGMMLALTRGIVAYNDVLRREGAAGWDFMRAPTVRRITGCVFGVIGLGRIGTAAALRAKALGMNVIFFDPYRPSGTELGLGVRRVDQLEALLAEADVLSIHAPLTAETDRMIDATTLSIMRPGSILINTSRGAIVNTAALLDALRDGRIAGAALDVLPEEPMAIDDPLISLWRRGEPWLTNRVILSPHAAFFSPSSLVDLRRKSAQVALDYLQHGRLRNCINGVSGR
jgi:lactate dehydrogenase-like 2-hydroxyacid dehydrogenase